MTAVEFTQRFWANVDIKSKQECWEWVGSRFSQGYGSVPLGKKRKKAHRIAYRLTLGKIPRGLCVLHSCDNPPCVNPYHLFLGTQGDNMKDMARKGRGNGWRGKDTHCSRGHHFSTSNTYLYRGRRRCKRCRSLAQRRFYASQG